MKNRVLKERKHSFYKMWLMIVITIITILMVPKIYAVTEVENIDEEVFKREYWQWHTRSTTDDMAYNGEHIEIKDNAITLYGYGQTSYKDFLYKKFSYTGKKIFKIIVDEKEASYHTLEGAGFIINSCIKENKISGYIMLYGQETIDIYRIDNVDVEELKTKSNMKISNYGTLIKSMVKQTSGIHKVIVETTPTYIKVTDNDQSMNITLDSTKHSGDSFGLIASYLQHSCSILSKIIFEKFELQIENYTIPVKTINMEEEPLAGANYQVKNNKGEVVRTGNSNTEGIFNMVGLQEGTYTINQISAPSGYKLNTNVITFKMTNEGKAINVDTGEEFEIVFINELISKQEEDKKDEENKEDNKDEINNQISNAIQNTTNTINQEEKLPDRLPQTGINSKLITVCIAFAVAIIYFAVKIRKYDYKE